ncbi:MAG: 1-acyl-sn-glycerol-3-phosphate acyltransferase [Chloroflexota bacterium]|nr:1-acyl-sn-glycerol-3-phosphate acyltransferase [Chloroflexota bacterium]
MNLDPDVVSWRFLRRAGRRSLERHATVTIEGRERVPATGPVLIAARHYHHLYDGCLAVDALDRPVHIVVGLDWIRNPLLRVAMTGLCRIARWPVVIRPEIPGAPKRGRQPVEDRRALLRQSARDTVDLLRAGRVVLVFPEGYPNIDPSFTPKQGDEFLPFHEGFVRYARLAERAGAGEVPIVPLGFHYERPEPEGRWRIVARYGAPVRLTEGSDLELVARIEAEVRRLSGASDVA